MKDVSQLVAGIEYKLGRLSEKHRQSGEENRKFRAEIEILRTQVEEQKRIIHELENRIKTLKIAKTLESKEGNVDVKLKINELVREIDKCIGLLNT